MIRKVNLALFAGIVVVFVCALLSAHAWSTQVDYLNSKLQSKQDEVTKLKSNIKSLKADNQSKDEKIIKLESQPK